LFGKNKNIMDEFQIWSFLCKEIGKLNNIIFAYDKIFRNIEINNGSYNNCFQLILDSFTVSITIRLDLFFQKRKNVFSLYRFTKIEKSLVDEIKKSAKEFIVMRNNKIGHLSNSIIHKDNFNFFTKKGIDEIKIIVGKIEDLLNDISRKYNFKQKFFHKCKWRSIDEEIECLLNDLKKYEKRRSTTKN